MKNIFVLLSILVLFGCAGESDKTDCTKEECKTGFHCNSETLACDKNCTDTQCNAAGKLCNPDLGICVYDCTKENCTDASQICNASTKFCEQKCSIKGCDAGFHCSENELCEINCKPEDCTGVNEVCDLENGICDTKAEYPCTENSCPADSHCNTWTGKCSSTCLDTGCSESMHCNLETQKCEVDCIDESCGETAFCDSISKSCKPFVAYPEGPYGKNVGDVVANIEWIDVDGKKTSLRKLHSMFKQTGYPRAILLVESAGWCDPCRMEAPLLEDLFSEHTLTNGFRKVDIIQTITQNNSGDPASSSFAKGWKTQYGITFTVVGDKDAKLEYYNAAGSIPFNMIVDPETMTIKNLQNGTDETLSGIRGILGILYTKNGPCKDLTCVENASCMKYPYNQDPKLEETVGCYCKTGYTMQSDGSCQKNDK